MAIAPTERLRLLLVEGVSFWRSSGGVGSFSCQQLSILPRLAAVFAEEVGDFGVFATDGPV